MHSTLEELRAYRTSTRALLDEGRHPLSVMLTADSRLVEVSNHVAICHRVTAEARAALGFALFSTRKRLLERIERAGLVLEELDEIQYELVDVKWDCVSRLQVELADLKRNVSNLMDKA